MPIAVGTSLALIIPISISSALGHKKRGTLDPKILRIWTIPIFLGVIIGATIAGFAEAEFFQIVFVIVASLISLRLLTGVGKSIIRGNTSWTCHHERCRINYWIGICNYGYWWRRIIHNLFEFFQRFNSQGYFNICSCWGHYFNTRSIWLRSCRYVSQRTSTWEFRFCFTDRMCGFLAIVTHNNKIWCSNRAQASKTETRNTIWNVFVACFTKIYNFIIGVKKFYMVLSGLTSPKIHPSLDLSTGLLVLYSCVVCPNTVGLCSVRDDCTEWS